MKVQDFIIELKKPTFLIADLVSRVLLLFAIAIFGYAVITAGVISWQSVVMAALVLGMAAWWIRCTVQAKKGKVVYYRFGLLLATIGWVIAYKSGAPLWLPILYFIVMAAEKQVKFPQEIAFNEKGIIINSFPQKQYEWPALNNVVLKDDILTIDFKNNKLIQKEIESTATAHEEKEFNEFCRTQLNAQGLVQNA